MNIVKKFCALLIALSITGFSVMAHDQQDKEPPDKGRKPVVPVKPKNDDNQNRDRDRDKKPDKGNKKPGEEL